MTDKKRSIYALGVINWLAGFTITLLVRCQTDSLSSRALIGRKSLNVSLIREKGMSRTVLMLQSTSDLGLKATYHNTV